MAYFDKSELNLLLIKPIRLAQRASRPPQIYQILRWMISDGTVQNAVPGLIFGCAKASVVSQILLRLFSSGEEVREVLL